MQERRKKKKRDKVKKEFMRGDGRSLDAVSDAANWNSTIVVQSAGHCHSTAVCLGNLVSCSKTPSTVGDPVPLLVAL